MTEPHEHYTIEGQQLPRVRVGDERPRSDSPCLGCGAYYGDLHTPGCDDEECPRCGGLVVSCGCVGAPRSG